MNRNAPTSPVTMARITGVLWLIVIVTGVTALVIRSTLIVRGDATATAKSILASESLFRFGLSADVVSFACYIGLTVIVYQRAFASFLSPAFGAQLSPYIVPAGLIGEGSLCMWLIMKGLNLARWNEQAGLTT